MELISWNVNGIRAALRKGCLEFFENRRPDVICLQETKAHAEQVTLELEGYHQYWFPAERKGYAGTAIWTRTAPKEVTRGLGLAEHDDEGRLITARYPQFTLVNVYTPNAQRGLRRLPYRTESWDPAFRKHLSELRQSGPVIFCGDLNVAHQAIDLANPKQNVRNPGFTPEERASFDLLFAEDGFVDTFRHFTPEGGHYTWWSQRAGVRERNIGWRIDYFCATPDILPRIQASYLLPEVLGSDHCPIVLELED